MTVNEIKEALSQLYAYKDFRVRSTVLALQAVVIKDRTAKGLKTEEGRDADPLPADYDALETGHRGADTAHRRAVQLRLPRNGLLSQGPSLRRHLRAQLVEPCRPRNRHRECHRRSAGMRASAQAHVNGARHFGVKDDEIHAIPAVLEEKWAPQRLTGQEKR